MNSKLYAYLLIGTGIFLFSCKTASKLYEKGNYDEAVELAAKKLQKDPDDPKLLGIIQDAYRFAVNDHESRISNNASSSNELRWEWMYNEYASLQRMYDAIYKVPSVFNLVKPTDYSSDLISYAEKAGDVRYDRGMAFLQHYDKQSYRQAYREFQAALKFIPGDRDITMRMNEAFNYAVTNVVVRPLQQQGGYVYSSYRVGADNFDDQLIRSLQFSSSNEFVRFYSAWDARSENIRVDKELDLRLAMVDIGRERDARDTRRVSKEVVVKETVYKPDSVVKEYRKVFADITTTRRLMNSSAVLQVSVRDADGRWQWSDDIPAVHSWSTEFSNFTGDERALSDADKQLVNRRKEFPPTESEIMRRMIEDISSDAQYRIRNYFMQF